MSSSPRRCTASVAEVFRSWQGEGLLLGRRQVFVRLAGCRVGCRYCDTAWAFDAPADVAVPGRPGERVRNPLDSEAVLALVRAAEGQTGPGAISLTGGEPLEQADFVDELLGALAPREVMLETSGLDRQALVRLGGRCRWIACDIKLPSATGLPDVLERHAAVLAGGLLDRVGVFFKLVVDGDVPPGELELAADLLARHAPRAPVFLQPVTPLGGSPPLPRERLDVLADVLLARGLDLRVVPQVHKLLGVR
jgi:organic radical activating enzyme